MEEDLKAQKMLFDKKQNTLSYFEEATQPAKY